MALQSVFAMIRHASPDAAVLLAAVGLCLIFLELNRPGLVAPGAFGVLLVLLAVFLLEGHSVQLWAVALLLASAGLFLLNLRFSLPVAVLGLATIALVAGIRYLLPHAGGAEVHTLVALPCGISLGALGALLTGVARRARRAKRVN